MNNVIKVRKNSQIDIGDYANVETGELLQDQIIGTNQEVTVKENTGLVKIVRSPGSYGTFSSESVSVLMNVLNNSDLGNVLKMSVDLKTDLNMVYNHTIPHSHETLQEYLGIKSESMYMKLISRLVKAGVVYKLEGLIQGEVRKTILINPFLFNKRANFNQKVIDVFSEFPISNNKSKKNDI